MEGIAFFETYFPLRAHPDWQPLDIGFCASCERVTLLWQRKTQQRCLGCVKLKQTYPLLKPDGSHFKVQRNGIAFAPRLSQGEFVLITPSQTIFWAQRDFHLIEPRVASFKLDRFREGLLNLMRQPPDEPWMFVGFARSNDPAQLHINYHNTIVRFSGSVNLGLTPLDGLIARERLLRIKQSFPLGTKEWRDYLYARTAAFEAPSGKYGDAARATLARFEAAHPALNRAHLPLTRSAECAILENL